jgi:hypothetical protein
MAFQEELTKIGRDYQAYEQARCRSPAYVNDPERQLKFLRADRFYAARVVKRFVKYFEATIGLEWPVRKRQGVRPDVFHLDQHLRSTWTTVGVDFSAIQNLSQLQKSGTRETWKYLLKTVLEEFLTCVFFIFLQRCYYIIIIIIQIQNAWYQIMKALKDKDTQRKGLIKVIYGLGGILSRMDTELFFKGITLIF